MSITYTLHLLAACIWVGGMFFAYVALRPVAAKLLEPDLRLPLWRDTFKRFFTWVWLIVAILPITGHWMIATQFNGMANVGTAVHVMMLIGWIMIGVFIFLFVKPYKTLTQHLSEKSLAAAAKSLNQIRKLVLINLSLGIITIIIASTHRF